jgi:hypothetical protein
MQHAIHSRYTDARIRVTQNFIAPVQHIYKISNTELWQQEHSTAGKVDDTVVGQVAETR